MTKPALGRGLNALLGGAPRTSAAASAPTPAPAAPSEPPAADGIRRVPLDQVQPCAFQPRRDFSTEELQELAESIREQGILQPLIVRERAGKFELIAGERRWRAARMAELTEVPVMVREADDRAVLEMALIENLQREDLNPIEEAEGYRQLADRFGLRQEDVASRVGKSRVAVANALRLLKLPADLQSHLRNGRLSVGHAKVILGLELPEKQALAADRVMRESLNVRQTEDLVARLQTGRGAPGKPGRTPASGVTDPQLAALEERLREHLGTPVRLRYRKGKGSVEIQFFSDDDLNRVLDVLGIQVD
ncbi:MAG: ParB/RepB/Spo0J family partition protein [Verrucomicrobiales bacterium]|nr:ParB/RepB/Spo0J family partition protein [Verrucomicrobiales bacterium]